MVTAELGVGALEGRVTVSLRLLDTATPSCQLCHPSSERASRCVEGVDAIDVRSCALEAECVRTRSCGSSSTGCAETSSLTLRENQYTVQFQRATRLHILAMATV